MVRLHIFGRIVDPITTEDGRREYFRHKDYNRCCCANKRKLIIKPTPDEAAEYLKLEAKYVCGIVGNNRKEYARYHELKNNYDWRTQLTERGDSYGLVSPTGNIILPPIFQDVFTQYDAIFSLPYLIPVYNGEGWGLATPGIEPLLVVDFKYSAIIPERWGKTIFFVQERETRLWGALQIEWTTSTHPRNRTYMYIVSRLSELMPPIAEDIYEDELITECSPIIFWMIRKGDKVGILSDCGYSEIAYDSYESDDDHLTFRLIRNDRKRAHRRSLYDPSGKHHIQI